MSDDYVSEPGAVVEPPCPHPTVRLELSAPASFYAPTDYLPAHPIHSWVHDSFTVMVDAYLETSVQCRGQAHCNECEAELQWDSPQVTQALANAAKVAHAHMSWEIIY